MERERLDKAMVLFVLSDPRLPFGQLRLRNAFDDKNPWLRSAYKALGPQNRVSCLYVGCGAAPRHEALLAAEAEALPRVLSNAATAIEVSRVSCIGPHFGHILLNITAYIELCLIIY